MQATHEKAEVAYEQFVGVLGDRSDYYYTFTGCASDLGLPVMPPAQIKVTGRKLGNGQPFVLTAVDDGCWYYQQAMGCLRLRLFND